MQTIFAGNGILDQLFGATAISVPGTYYLGLSTTTISQNGTGATEPSGYAYARVGIPNTKSYFTVASDLSLSNSQQISFTESTGSWGTITHVFLSSDLTGGTMWFYAALSTPKVVQAYTTVTFGIGALVFYLE